MAKITLIFFISKLLTIFPAFSMDFIGPVFKGGITYRVMHMRSDRH